jgi:hypothetical protein
LRIAVAASGGNPAVLEMFSATGATSFLRLGAQQILFGDNTVFDDATDTLTTTLATIRSVMAWGAPFGTDNKMLWWIGPPSVAFANCSRANAFFYIAIDAPRMGGSDLPVNAVATKDGPVNSVMQVLIPAGQSKTAVAFLNTAAGAGSSSVTIQLQYREAGAGAWINVGANDAEFGGPGDQLSAGIITGVIANSVILDTRYDVQCLITFTGSPGAINQGKSYLKI